MIFLNKLKYLFTICVWVGNKHRECMLHNNMCKNLDILSLYYMEIIKSYYMLGVADECIEFIKF